MSELKTIRLNDLAIEFDAKECDGSFEPPHPIFQMAEEIDQLRQQLAEESKSTLRHGRYGHDEVYTPSGQTWKSLSDELYYSLFDLVDAVEWYGKTESMPLESAKQSLAKHKKAVGVRELESQPEAGEAVGEVFGTGVNWVRGKAPEIGAKLYTHPAPVVPEGYVMVPVEPTVEMLEAGAEHLIRVIEPDDGEPKDIALGILYCSYKAMIKAAQEKEPLLKPAGHIQTGCYCKRGRCMAPVVMGQQTKCLDPNKAAQEQG